ncbi:two-component response regulator ARR14 [Tripterygium wilfordii]|uniref:Two-component response regulator ARR14 n=1 Tax=Tripterygium wilfordii TaxID=458696 RepID=A0A7J7DD88_TRIWF|nr:two-component response regulator ARR14 [Tripterygium wilfordii]
MFWRQAFECYYKITTGRLYADDLPFNSISLPLKKVLKFFINEGSVVVDLSENDAQSYTSLSVLVVDCDTECLTIVSDMLRRFEYKVITAKRAADALCIVRETENELDLILTETHLPDMKISYVRDSRDLGVKRIHLILQILTEMNGGYLRNYTALAVSRTYVPPISTVTLRLEKPQTVPTTHVEYYATSAHRESKKKSNFFHPISTVESSLLTAIVTVRSSIMLDI